MYRSKELTEGWEKKTWLGSFKSDILCLPTPGFELKKLMQAKEKDMWPGGKEDWSVKIIETAGKTLECV